MPPTEAPPGRGRRGHAEGVPFHWRHKAPPGLIFAITAYLNGHPLSAADMAALQAYLRQWIEAPGFRGFTVDELRREVDGLTTRKAVTAWLHKADSAGVDPL